MPWLTTDDPTPLVSVHPDPLGSAWLVTEGKASAIHAGILYSKGQVVQRYAYAPFGAATFQLNPNLGAPSPAHAALLTTPAYTGHRALPGLGLVTIPARDLDPTWGRFLTPDPVVSDPTDAQAYNRYAYARNNPFRYTDPTGYSAAAVAEAPADRASLVDAFYDADYAEAPRASPLDPAAPNLVADTTGAKLPSPATPSALPAWYAPAAQQHYNSTATGRRPNTVYVTGHQFVGRGPYHTAIEFTDELGKTTWVSAGPEWGRLVSGQGQAYGFGVYNAARSTDRSSKNERLGTVTPPAGETSGAYFERVRTVDRTYYDCLGYPYVDAGRITGRPNSNTYTRELIERTGGTTSVEFGEYWGGNNSIPDQYFK
ncbi:MAG: hypothetical protein HYV02_07315 [Deltaproteobacteria bacterium]|nr:hypothetical protein [Deltaproteobacteria bacterium]